MDEQYIINRATKEESHETWREGWAEKGRLDDNPA